MSDSSLAAFNHFLYQHIPSVKFMQLKLLSCDDNTLLASAPAKPNLNDKQTIFGGSSSALMTVCAWSLIKYNLEQRDFKNDVVIADAQSRWLKAQSDALSISVNCDINWDKTMTALNNNESVKPSVQCQVKNQQNQLCTTMTARYVILVKGTISS
ncbi:MAG: thioesterase domain-containing protein [Proteobacteria bacterium]|nr:thioesterase domain-containing protein [Pseudomonadota bacterium]